MGVSRITDRSLIVLVGFPGADVYELRGGLVSEVCGRYGRGQEIPPIREERWFVGKDSGFEELLFRGFLGFTRRLR